MSDKYILAIDQSTSGTKAIIFDQAGTLLARKDLPHDQMVSEKGWVEHNPEQIYHNTIAAVRAAVELAGIDKKDILSAGISNQRETAVVWDKATGKSVYPAIVWQCARGAEICSGIEALGYGDFIRSRTGLQLSPYFSAAKISWVLKNVPGLQEKLAKQELCAGTVDSYLVFRLTGGKSFKTDYSNASRTQLFNIMTLKWDEEICRLFDIPVNMLAEVCYSDTCFGETDFEGFLEEKIKIHAVLGDSHGALFGQGCLGKGMIKTTYGTGSSIMMNIGKKPVLSQKGVVTSLAWGINNEVSYVLEGNINYTGAVIKWLIEEVGLINSAKESEDLAFRANKEDRTYLVPAFSGLGAPYWDSKAEAALRGMTRTTGKAEIVKAAVECIAYQITDIVRVMSEEAGIEIDELRVDGGPTRNSYLMQFQSDMLKIPVQVPVQEELSGIGAGYLAGIASGLYDGNTIFESIKRSKFEPAMEDARRNKLYEGWLEAVKSVLDSHG